MMRSGDQLKNIHEERSNLLLSTLGARGLLASESGSNPAKVTIDNRSYPLIGIAPHINAGAYLDIGGNTAIIVDFDADHRLQQVIERFAPAFERIGCIETRYEGLIGLASAIARLLRYDANSVTDIYHQDYQSPSVVPRFLGEFIDLHIGICAQQALLTGAALEYAIHKKYLPETSTVSLEQSYDSNQKEYHISAKLYIDNECWSVDPTKARSERAEKQEFTAQHLLQNASATAS